MTPTVDPTPYEALGDRRFQLFCQSLLTFEFPQLQALPVGQPDGGRDAFQFHDPPSKGFAVFQVKFVERPDYLKDVRTWIRDVIEAEATKINRLAEAGATNYYLLTNVPGSAHGESGSVDQANAALADLDLPLPAQVWWRNDIAIRLAKHPTLRWTYRELLTGSDLLHELVTTQLQEDNQRRSDAIRASMSAQYDNDQTVRFKQVDLQNDLLELFVDVPIGGSARERLFMSQADPPGAAPMRDAYPVPAEAEGAATFILGGGEDNAEGRRWVVEGAPGQGKSTLAQYLCQVHRMRLLGRGEDLGRISNGHQACPLRLPFKVDLRELATFLRGGDPWADVSGWKGIPDGLQRSVEGFLAAQVQRYSGGATFDVSDVLAIARTSPILLIFDGLDEVADVSDRRTIVDAVQRSLASINGVALRLDVIVTSRPPQFANSPGFPPRQFRYFSLASLTPALIRDYTARWISARKLAEEERAEVLGVLDAKLDERHIRDLARNPMQLAILLQLINTSGESLPDKRTQLYSDYMKLFFMREAAKSTTVRQHRDLLWGFHAYLAWTLHSRAERSSQNGSISKEDLRQELTNYVADYGSDGRLVEQLFQGVVDRIFALVATRQERFEFEVQPLREFFAADYLYATAQVSQFGQARPGTRADRFATIARNAYWFNVARFYAGFYTSGELPALADGVEEFAQEDSAARTDRPRTLAATLLADYSFSLDRRSRIRMVRTTLDGLGIRHAMGSSVAGNTRRLVLPAGSGREEAAAAIIASLQRPHVTADRLGQLTLALQDHIAGEEFAGDWLTYARSVDGQHLTDWTVVGAQCDVLTRIDFQELRNVLCRAGDETHQAARVNLLLSAGLWQAVQADSGLAPIALRLVLDGDVVGLSNERPASLLELFNRVLGTARWMWYGSPAYWKLSTDDVNTLVAQAAPSSLDLCRRVLRLLLDERGRPIRPGVAELKAWGLAMEDVVSEHPDAWMPREGAVSLASSRRRKGGTRSGGLDLIGRGDLVARVQAARMRSGASQGDWWSRQIAAAERPIDRALILICALIWTSGDAFATVVDALEAIADELSPDLYSHVERTIALNPGQRATQVLASLSASRVKRLNIRVASLLMRAGDLSTAATVWNLRLATYKGSDRAVLSSIAWQALGRARSDSDWSKALRLAKRTYQREGNLFLPHTLNRLPASVALAVMQEPRRYPLDLVGLAEAELGSETARQAKPVGTVARQERWFAS